MDEVIEDYYVSQREKSLARPKAKLSRGKGGHVSRKEFLEKCSPVVVVRYPRLETLPERLRYLQNKSNTVTFCQNCRIGLKAYQRLLRGGAADRHLLKRIADACNCPLDWLMGKEKKMEEVKDAAIQNELPHFDALSARVTWARERKQWTVTDLAHSMKWAISSMYRVLHGDQPLYENDARRLSEALEVPFEWLTEGVALSGEERRRTRTGQAPQKEKPQKELPQKKAGICLHIEGEYNAEQVGAILSGFGNEIYHITLELIETG